MNKNLSDLTVILDRSGSMWSCKKDAEDGLNTFIEEQKKGVGEANFTLIQFDDIYEVVHNGVPIKNVGKCKLVPRGGTALFDAIGKTIVTIGERLAKLPEDERPGLVAVLIITDGGENASKEYTSKEKIAEMIKHQVDKYSWSITYLGANQDGFAEGASYGTTSSATYEAHNTGKAFQVTSSKFSRMRGMSSMGLAVDDSYTKEEEDSLVK